MPENADADAERRIDLYTSLWTLFRDRPFDTETLARRLVERGEHDAISAADEPGASLSWLVDAGVLTETADGYRVTVKPNAGAEMLAEAGSLDAATVRGRLLSSLTADDDGPRALSREDGTYAVVELGVGESVDRAVERVRTAVREADHRGVVLATPGTNADLAQRLADRLADEGSWSKAWSTVVEGDGEELVFRLYMDR